MIRRFALWLAEVTDRWARRLHDDAAGERLAVADDLEAWQVDCGTLIPSTVMAPLLHLDDMHARRQARKRHPAGSRRT